MQKIVFTDLDGTLLDSATYSYQEALIAIALLQKKQIPLAFCSAKTRAEQEVYRQELKIADPFIVENGGAIFVPQGYFSFPFPYHKVAQNYLVIELGISYEKIRQALKQIEREVGLSIKGFGDMSVAEVAEETGLSLEFADRAKQREYDETFKLEGDEAKKRLALSKFNEVGLNYAHGGRYYDAMGGNDKGKATELLIELFKKKFIEIKTIGIGDSQNDLPMLTAVDIPVLVQKPGNHWEEVDLANVHKVAGIGPEGWRRAIEELIA
jgi:mannosyl-3-phosphoglycerate phosphatase